MISRIRHEPATIDVVVFRSRWCYKPRNLHYRRQLDPRVISWTVAALIGAGIWYVVLSLAGVV